VTQKALFDAIRIIKGSALTQQDVDRVNRALSAPETATVSQAAIDLIHSFESFKANAYPDPGSKNGLPVTIGWGSTSDLNGRPIKLGTVWTREQADAKFAQDIEKFADGVREVAGPSTRGQIDAMVSFAYNVGLAAFKSSTLLKKHLAGDYAGAKSEFGKWVFNDGARMRGLERRRKAEAEMYAS
jgi:GH24 family phage-related lysozyme (muramidase)